MQPSRIKHPDYRWVMKMPIGKNKTTNTIMIDLPIQKFRYITSNAESKCKNQLFVGNISEERFFLPSFERNEEWRMVTGRLHKSNPNCYMKIYRASMVQVYPFDGETVLFKDNCQLQ